MYLLYLLFLNGIQKGNVSYFIVFPALTKKRGRSLHIHTYMNFLLLNSKNVDYFNLMLNS